MTKLKPTIALTFLVLLFSLRECQGLRITSKSKSFISVEDEAATLWCATDSTFTTCEWQLPDGATCQVGPTERECRADTDITFSGTAANCSIKIDRLREDQSGTWTCILNDGGNRNYRESINVTLAQAPDLEIKDAFGTVVIIQGQTRTFLCEAERARLPGVFLWQIGDAKDPKGVITLTNPNLPQIRQDGNGYYSAAETLTYLSNTDHDERKLYCRFRQTDETGKELFTREDHVTLKIFYLEEPKQGKTEVPNTAAGTNLTVTLQFEAKPKPEARDVVWQISSALGSMQIETDESEIVKRDHYLAFPLKRIGESRFEATLVILNVAESEQTLDHSLKISSRDKKESEPFHSVTHRFSISVGPHNEQGGYEEKETESVDMANSTTIIIVIVIVLILIIVAGGIVFYLKKNQKYCFASEAQPLETKVGDPETQTPLNEDDPNMRPIIKQQHRFGRPE